MLIVQPGASAYAKSLPRTCSGASADKRAATCAVIGCVAGRLVLRVTVASSLSFGRAGRAVLLRFGKILAGRITNTDFWPFGIGCV